ncbi:mannose-6-phosphate isomerase, class I [Enterovibrio paralichthyis]|uniref:mannose-6-phosphate isomerase, class I n=1 Tax=Enterovibrio paralichthyis TaxID=2853805 RepID=UPI001C483F7B|nr:mannose-6-phosphate isomerase, class I [Enterovibrio paralichthyis]MBV7299140.1 mannose-6-phosphate isomerase, class I [Enterovibrio paralichthyis]
MTTHFFPLNNVIQDYAWGSYTSLTELFDMPNPDNKPQAEIWMGAHPNGCSKIAVEGNETLLSNFIGTDMAAILGADTAAMFGELPYLFKVLCAEKALSVQVHPSKAQAEAGFAKEEAAGIPLSASFRNYKDPNHKPELVFALTPYTAMNGFRDFSEILGFFHQLNISELSALVAELEANQTEQGLSAFFGALLSLEGEVKEACVNKLLAFAEANQDDELFALLLTLATQYPGDIGLFSPLILNTLTLNPGDAMFLDACTPHAYIKGTGLEIMANSDNVLRAGLTPKHMDVPELISCTRCVPMPKDEILLAPVVEGNAQHYPIPVPDFKFSVYRATENEALNTESAEILIAVDAPLTVTHADGETVTLNKGESVFIPAYVGEYFSTCSGVFARAYN